LSEPISLITNPHQHDPMTVDEETRIELSRARLALMILGALLMAGLGGWMMVADAQSSLIVTLRRFAPPEAVHLIGGAGVLFFGGCAVYAVRKLFDRKPGLILNAAGLVDNSSAVAAGFIPWSEISGVSMLVLGRQRMVSVHLVNPERYASRGNAVKRALNRANMGLCGTPIVISSTVLAIPFDELLRTLESFTSRYAAPAGEGVPADAWHPAS
jgi:hypothetical protein